MIHSPDNDALIKADSGDDHGVNDALRSSNAYTGPLTRGCANTQAHRDRKQHKQTNRHMTNKAISTGWEGKSHRARPIAGEFNCSVGTTAPPGFMVYMMSLRQAATILQEMAKPRSDVKVRQQSQNSSAACRRLMRDQERTPREKAGKIWHHIQTRGSGSNAVVVSVRWWGM